MTRPFKYNFNLRDHLPPNEEGEFLFMGEAIVVRRGIGTASVNIPKLVTKIITKNNTWTAPKAVNKKFNILIFGGGGGGSGGGTSGAYGGGGGFMNNGEFVLNEGEQVQITIGAGGIRGYSSSNAATSGGTTSFGSYLSANGGGAGGTGGMYKAGGGDGGAGGGALGAQGGIGYQFGGGGAEAIGGNGGKWGGGGGSSGKDGTSKALGGCVNGNTSNLSGLAGNGGYNTYAPGNGKNTIAIENVLLAGCGIRGNGFFAGGGGYGGNGGAGLSSSSYNEGAGGGGGYGAKGGSALKTNYGNGGCGGGGGYGHGDGGDGYTARISSSTYIKSAGGGGGYGHGGDMTHDGEFGGGGGGATNANYCTNGGPGICIIQYYTE